MVPDNAASASSESLSTARESGAKRRRGRHISSEDRGFFLNYEMKDWATALTGGMPRSLLSFVPPVPSP
jgi:hypothetical protein